MASERTQSPGGRSTPAKVTPATSFSSEKQDATSVAVAVSEPGPAPLSVGPDAAEFPDGGLKAWSVVFGSWCLMFASIGWTSCIGVFQDYYQRNQLASYSPSSVAWISSTLVFVMFAGAPAFGKVFDNFGARPLLVGGTFCHVFGLMMVSVSSQYYQIFLSQAILSALGASAIFYAAINPIGTWFFKRRAFAFGVISTGSSLCGVVVPIMIENLIDEIGFGWTMRTCAFLFLGLGIIGIVLVHSRLPPSKSPVVLSSFIAPFTEPVFLLNSLASFFFFWGVLIPTNFIILEGQYQGISLKLSGYLLSILNATSIFGRIIPGWIGDRVGRFNVMIATTLLTGVLVLALWLPAADGGPPGAAVAFAALFGFTSGTYLSMTPALIAQITADMRQIGVRTGSSYLVISFAVLTGNPVAGALVARGQHGAYLYAQAFCGAAMLLGCALFVAARHAQVGWTRAAV